MNNDDGSGDGVRDLLDELQKSFQEGFANLRENQRILREARLRRDGKLTADEETDKD